MNPTESTLTESLYSLAFGVTLSVRLCVCVCSLSLFLTLCLALFCVLLSVVNKLSLFLSLSIQLTYTKRAAPSLSLISQPAGSLSNGQEKKARKHQKGHKQQQHQQPKHRPILS